MFAVFLRKLLPTYTPSVGSQAPVIMRETSVHRMSKQKISNSEIKIDPAVEAQARLSRSICCEAKAVNRTVRFGSLIHLFQETAKAWDARRTK